MPTSKPTTAFVIRIVGKGLRPWDVPMRSLTRIFNAVQRLIENTESDVAELDEDEEQQSPRPLSPIQLLDVKSGSAAYPVAAFDGTAALKTLGNMGRNLNNPSEADWDSVSLSSIEEISAAAKSIGHAKSTDCYVEICDAYKHGNVIAKITPETYDDIAAGAFIHGDSSIYGYLERIGGATRPHCGLRVAAQPEKMVICHVASEDLVRELGPYVYKNVRVSGKVTWFKKNWHVKTINVQAFEPVQTGSIRDALNAVYEAGGKAWDDVEDPEALIKGAR
jgi:hypothetical protein